MRTSCLILSSLSVLACWGETASATTDHELNDFRGLVLALKDLDYGSVPSYPAPEFFLPTSQAKNASAGCAVNVSIEEQI